MLALVLALLQVHVPGLPEHRVADIFKPMASPAEAEKNIAMLVIAITGAIFLVVGGLIVFTVLRSAEADRRSTPGAASGVRK